jgi:hypothetical protein
LADKDRSEKSISKKAVLQRSRKAETKLSESQKSSLLKRLTSQPNKKLLSKGRTTA